MHQAIREALANCLVNADFYIRRGIVIKKEIHQITLENPGYIRTGKKQMLKGGISDPRNKALMKMFNLIGIGERADSGVPDIFAVWKNEGWEEPTVEEQFDPNRTLLILPLRKQAKKTSELKQAKKTSELKQAKKTLQNKKKILDFIGINHASSTHAIAQWIGLSDARTRVLLKEMIEDGLLDSTGKTKQKKYSLLREDDQSENNDKIDVRPGSKTKD